VGKLIYAINVSLDGCCDHTKMIGGSDEVHQHFTHLIRDAALLVYGRVTYQLMVPYWPDVAKAQSASKITNEFAATFDSVPKLVFSHSLKTVEDKKSRLASANPKDEILKLKRELTGNMLLGGVDLPAQLTDLGLIDEYHIVVQPIVVGKGRRLFDAVNLRERLQLKLAHSKIFNSGFTVLHYVKQ
jgi:dihydrofolate reductase